MDRTDLETYMTKHGVSLDALGIKEIGLPREEALGAIFLIREAKLPILGGDVYRQVSSVLMPDCSNWYCEPKSNEGPHVYLQRSWSAAEDYIKNYPVHSDYVPLFVIVLGKLV